VTIRILDGANADRTSDFVLTQGSYLNGANADLSTLTIKANQSSLPVPGTYTLDIVAYAGLSHNEGTKTFTVTGTPITTTQATLGSYANTLYGSSIDLDDGSVMFASAATQANSGVDIVVTYAAAPYNTLRVMSPDYASTTSGITAFQNWASPNVTYFNKVSGIDYASITTKEQIEALFDPTSAQANTGVLSCTTGDIIVVKTDMDNYALVLINSFDASTSGTVTIKSGL